MNQVTTVPQHLQALQLPTEATQLMALADRLCLSRAIPTVFQKSAPDCFNVLSICMRYGFDFYSTIWECSIIKGRLFFSGKMVHAMLNASGFLLERLNFEYSGEGQERMVTVSGRLQGETERRVVPVLLKEVKTDNENWRKQPDQQLSYAGARIWGRRHLPEVLLGMLFEDEAEMIDITPERVSDETAEIAKARMNYFAHGTPVLKNPVSAPPAMPERIKPGQLPTPDLEQDGAWRTWATTFIGHIRAAESIEEIDEWLECNQASLDMMHELETKMRRTLDDAIAKQKRKAAGEA